MTPDAIQRFTNLPMELIQYALPLLESPDLDSKSKDCEGRRIVRLEEHRSWGWRIVNFLKYRESATIEMTRMCETLRKRVYREKFKKNPPHTPPKGTEGEADAEAELSPDKSGTVRDKLRLPQTELEAGEWAEMSGVPKEFGSSVFCQVAGRNWKDGAGIEITDFRHYVKHRWNRDQNDKAEKKQQGAIPKRNGHSILDMKTVRDAKQQEAEKLKNDFATPDPFGSLTWKDQKYRERYRQLGKEIKQINENISNAI